MRPEGTVTVVTRQRSAVPYDADDEAVLLGAALATRPAAEVVATQTTTADFHDPYHQRVRDAIATLYAAGEPVEVATVASDLARHNGVADLALAKKRLWTLREACAAPSNFSVYLQSVREWTKRRAALTLAIDLDRIAHAGGSLVRPLETQLEEVRGDLSRLMDTDAGAAVHERLMSGGLFVAGAELGAGPLHGDGDDVLHAAGEPTLVVAGTGLGKSTYAQNYMLHRVSLRTEPWLGLPVAPLPLDRSILYIAADRPRQIQRSLRRMVSTLDYPVMDEAIVFWRGPLPFLINQDPLRLAAFVRALEISTKRQFDEVVLDSLKDVAVDLAKDEGGSAVAVALARLVADDRNVLVLHHERKAERVAKKAPGSIDDIYGSQFLGACAGNVIYLYGEPGAHILTLHHLKQSSDQVGPLTLRHDHTTGRLELEASPDLLAVLRRRPQGMTAKDACLTLYSDENPVANTIEKARRRLDRLVNDRLAWRRDGIPGTPNCYFPSETRHGQ